MSRCSSTRTSKAWIEAALNGNRRVGLPWQSLRAFLRIATNPRALAEPFPPREAWDVVETWLDAPTAWVPLPTRGHREVLGRLVTTLDLRGNLVADSDFARFSEIEWVNPIE